MQTFRVDDMTCGHCTSAVTKALKAADGDAKVTIDLTQHLVMVESTEADAQELSDAIAEAGYTPVPVERQPAGATTAPRAGGCCCGSGSSGCRG